MLWLQKSSLKLFTHSYNEQMVLVICKLAHAADCFDFLLKEVDGRSTMMCKNQGDHNHPDESQVCA